MYQFDIKKSKLLENLTKTVRPYNPKGYIKTIVIVMVISLRTLIVHYSLLTGYLFLSMHSFYSRARVSQWLVSLISYSFSFLCATSSICDTLNLCSLLFFCQHQHSYSLNSSLTFSWTVATTIEMIATGAGCYHQQQ